jgi:ClpP class serine protease
MNLSVLDISRSLIPTGKIAMEPKYGANLMQSYLSELMQIAMGIPAANMGYGDRKAASIVQTIEVKNDKNKFSSDKIAIVNINGMIRGEDGLCSIGMATMADQLLKEKNNVTGAIFKINSGGGYMDGAEMMIAAIREFGKPTVSIGHFMGSAAYMIASETNQILAQTEMSEFGSIGVLIELNKEFKNEYKEKVDVIYAETSADKNEAFRKWLNDDLTGYIQLANEADKFFMKLVKRNRDLKGEDNVIKETLAGKMFYADDAKERGLIDGRGDNNKAISLIQKLNRL